MNSSDIKNYTIREAIKSDMQAVSIIFNKIILNTTATFEEHPYTVEKWNKIFDSKIENKYPFLVAEMANQVVAYGTYGVFRYASGYFITVEHSLHVDQKFRGLGIGQSILSNLIDIAAKSGIHNLIAAIDTENHISIQLHKKFGFTEVGRLNNIAKKFSKYVSLMLMQKKLYEK